MAATDARPVPRKNTAFRYSFAIRKNDGTLITSWTGADSEVSVDGAAFADCTNEATEIGTSGCGYIDFTAAEMNGDSVMYKLTVTNTSALAIVITFFPEESGDYRVDTVLWNGLSTVALPLAPTVAGRTLDVSTGGEAGIDWANVGSPTTAVALSGTTISTAQTFASAGGDTAGTTTLLGRLTSLRASNLDNISATPPTVAQIVAGVWNEPKSSHVTAGTYGLFLDATVSTRSTYAGGDTSGITTLLSRVSSARAGHLDSIPNLALASQIPASFTEATFESAGVLSTAALANAPSGGGGGGSLTTHATAYLYGPLTVNSDGSWTYFDPGTSTPRVKFSPVALPGGRTVTLY
jgi:hypothetical protein